MVAALTPAALHGTAFAVLTLANNAFGLAPGPIVTGWLADQIGLLGALRLLPFSSLIAALVFTLSTRSTRTAIRSDKARMTVQQGQHFTRIIPGLALCALVSAAAYVLQQFELAASGRAWIEALVIAILGGAAIRMAWTPSERWKPGIDFSAKLVLEIAVVLLGASVSAATIWRPACPCSSQSSPWWPWPSC